MAYIDGNLIKQLREHKQLTQKQLADRLSISDKTVSKWETGRGLPDISILPELAEALGISLAEMMTGNIVKNENVSGNMRRMGFYVCPVCGNVIQSIGKGAFSCCGVTLPKLEAEDGAGEIQVQVIDGDYYVSLDHPMTKSHYISFLAYVTTDRIYFTKLYPEQDAACTFPRKGMGAVYAYCNRHGLFAIRVR